MALEAAGSDETQKAWGQRTVARARRLSFVPRGAAGPVDFGVVPVYRSHTWVRSIPLRSAVSRGTFGNRCEGKRADASVPFPSSSRAQEILAGPAADGLSGMGHKAEQADLSLLAEHQAGQQARRRLLQSRQARPACGPVPAIGGHRRRGDTTWRISRCAKGSMDAWDSLPVAFPASFLILRVGGSRACPNDRAVGPPSSNAGDDRRPNLAQA